MGVETVVGTRCYSAEDTRWWCINCCYPNLGCVVYVSLAGSAAVAADEGEGVLRIPDSTPGARASEALDTVVEQE